MANPSSRQGLIDYCLRRLGDPVIEINVDDDQVEDRLDEAVQYYQDFHYDSIVHTYTAHVVTTTDVANQYLPVSNNVVGITRIFPLGSTNANVNMFEQGHGKLDLVKAYQTLRTYKPQAR